MCQLRQLQTRWNEFKDKYASLFAGVHVQSSAYLSVRIFFHYDIFNRTTWSISTKNYDGYGECLM